MGSRTDSGRRRTGPLAFLRNLNDLDTLDTRFTTPSSVPYRAANDKREDDANLHKADKRAEPPKWNTPEYYLYYLVLGVAVPYMFWIAYDVSRRRFPISVEQGGRRAVLTLGSVGSEIQQV
jgi:hypothetical protein